MYTLSNEGIPKYKLGNLCYENCPSLTTLDNLNCKCNYGWEQNSTTKEITCYSKKEYCLSKDYYYHNDTKECSLNSCKDNYYQFNFQCYNNKCPDNTQLISSSPYICESIFDFCFINNNFQTHCKNEAYNGYNFRYKDTKIYFKYCNESLFFF